MLVKYTNIDLVPVKLYKNLRDCSLRREGYMVEVLQGHRSGSYKTELCLVADITSTEDYYVRGWSLFTKEPGYDNLQVYVKKKYRNQGIATTCVQNVTKLVENKKPANIHVDNDNIWFWKKIHNKGIIEVF